MWPRAVRCVPPAVRPRAYGPRSCPVEAAGLAESPRMAAAQGRAQRRPRGPASSERHDAARLVPGRDGFGWARPPAWMPRPSMPVDRRPYAWGGAEADAESWPVPPSPWPHLRPSCPAQGFRRASHFVNRLAARGALLTARHYSLIPTMAAVWRMQARWISRPSPYRRRESLSKAQLMNQSLVRTRESCL